MNSFKKVLDKAIHGLPLTPGETLRLLSLTGYERQQLFSAARLLRDRCFGRKVFLYGFVYFSTFCRNDCSFCCYRKSNSNCERYSKSIEEIVSIAAALAQSGVHLIDLTMGEDPAYLAADCEKLIRVVEQVKDATRLPLMISPGVVPRSTLRALHQAGADWYACYQETHNRQLFASLRLKQSYDERWSLKVFAKNIGMLVEEGLLVGVGDKAEDAAHSLQAMRKLGAEQIRTMSFVPQQGTPLEYTSPVNDLYELNVIAVMRILFPDRLIPASLDVAGVRGLKDRLDAGANVVTSIIPPGTGLVGVSQSTLDVAEGYRTVKGILPILAECDLAPATLEDYLAWMIEHRAKRNPEESLC